MRTPYQNLTLEQLMQINVDETIINAVVLPVLKSIEHNNSINKNHIYQVATFAYQVFASFLEIQGHSFEKNSQRELSSYVTGVAAALYWFTKQAIDEDINLIDVVIRSGMASQDDLVWLEECTVKHTFFEKRRNDLLARIVYDFHSILPVKLDKSHDRDRERLLIYHYLKMNKSIPLYQYNDEVLISVKALKASGIIGFYTQVSNEKKSPFIKYFNMHNNDKTDTTRKFVVIGKKGEIRLEAIPATNIILDEMTEEVSAIDENTYIREQHVKAIKELEEGRHISEVIDIKPTQEPEEIQKPIEVRPIEVVNKPKILKEDANFDPSKFKYLTSYQTKMINGALYLVFDSVLVNPVQTIKAVKTWEKDGLIERVDDNLIISINGIRYLKLC